MTKPLVAVVGYHLALGRVTRWDSGAFAIPDPYVQALRRAGVETAVLPPSPSPEPDLLGRFDGLLLAGGGDVVPSRYGATDRHARVYGENAERDELELSLLRMAANAGIPTLAICRGVQVANVAFGGTLHQHLPDVDGMAEHAPDGGGVHVMHGVRVAGGSRLEAACGRQVARVASYHHQGLDRLGDGVVPVAWSVDDGLVEAVELEAGWVVAVQWHPEITAAEDPAQQALFDAFAEQTRARNASSVPHIAAGT